MGPISVLPVLSSSLKASFQSQPLLHQLDGNMVLWPRVLYVLKLTKSCIPICQQHLIWNNLELEDDYCLNDYNVSEDCTLKLVLAMRGGPINTRKVPMEDPLREMAKYMDPSQDEVWEKASCSRQVPFLVYREGDQLNFFYVVDRGDGTLTPLSESLSGGSVYNLCTDEDGEVDLSPSGQKTTENSITMNKMKLLKAKMESMNLGRKVTQCRPGFL
ncbi:AN1-type zinc finger protein 4 [Heterocephalus glaber]|uniref:AN1-type zinc finger protein 4 n=1 Tax=Heterocephalus glaber TaxID=10181 RepID=A0AAX6SJA6_HETGA|nr:AN1-type zinc finger protein 4 [Heterocephalus glaber]